jgi:hypothetical protein
MKTLNITAVLTSLLLVAASAAYADSTEKHNINQQNLSRQPYKQTPAKDQVKSDGFEGATLINETAETEKKSRQLQLHRFDRRPYMEKSAD